MIPEGNMPNNVERFSGFQSLYDRYRPEAPQMVIEVLTRYLGHKPVSVVDLGCGTGLSSFVWKGFASWILGVEPNDDMRSKALERLHHEVGVTSASTSNTATLDASDITFVKGFSNQVDVGSGTVDIITCSQSFHWMDPVSTLHEASRILRDGGVFAAYDCDWPATVDWRIEQEYDHLMDKVDQVIALQAKEEDLVKKWPKDEHLKNMKESQVFRFTKEVVFHNRELCDAQRYIGLALSQGGLQTVLKSGWVDMDEDIKKFKDVVEAHFGKEKLEVVFSYRMRLGVK